MFGMIVGTSTRARGAAPPDPTERGGMFGNKKRLEQKLTAELHRHLMREPVPLAEVAR